MSYSGLTLFGEVLFDCFPDGNKVLGGAPFNVAWHCQAFGMQPLFISRVGDDLLGKEIVSAMRAWGMSTEALQIDSMRATGRVDVSFNNGEPCYDIVEHSAWDFIDYKKMPPINTGSILYHGTLALRNPVSAESLNLLKQQYQRTTFIDVNLRPPWNKISSITHLMQDCRWIKLNQEELAELVPGENDIVSKSRKLLTQFGAEYIIVTQGADGVTAVSLESACTVRPEISDSIIDTVGAGDAFCSVLLLGLYNEWALQDILHRAQQFASAVICIQGATTQDKEFYRPFIQAWELG